MAQTAVREKEHETGLDLAPRRPQWAETRSVVDQSSCSHDSSLRSSSREHDEP